MKRVVGATGRMGRAVCRGLREAGLPVRALARPGSAGAAALAESGVEVVRGDLGDPASLAAAGRGADAVISTATATARKDRLAAVDRDGQLALVGAARAVRASGMAWTVLQPSCFMEIWFSPLVGWDVAKGRVRIYGTGERPVSFVSLEDVAQIAVWALQRREAENRDMPVGGPEPVAPLAAAALFEKASGRTLRRQHVPPGVLRVVARLVVPFQPTMGSLMLLGVAIGERGDPIDMTALQRELSLRLTSVADHAARSAGAAAGR
jgi:uncharacterized protein YbjT (DUF2867 family)